MRAGRVQGVAAELSRRGRARGQRSAAHSSCTAVQMMLSRAPACAPPGQHQRPSGPAAPAAAALGPPPASDAGPAWAGGRRGVQRGPADGLIRPGGWRGTRTFAGASRAGRRRGAAAAGLGDLSGTRPAHSCCPHLAVLVLHPHAPAVVPQVRLLAAAAARRTAGGRAWRWTSPLGQGQQLQQLQRRPRSPPPTAASKNAGATCFPMPTSRGLRRC